MNFELALSPYCHRHMLPVLTECVFFGRPAAMGRRSRRLSRNAAQVRYRPVQDVLGHVVVLEHGRVALAESVGAAFHAAVDFHKGLRRLSFECVSVPRRASGGFERTT